MAARKRKPPTPSTPTVVGPPANPSAALTLLLEKAQVQLNQLQEQVNDLQWFVMRLEFMVRRYHPSLMSWRCKECHAYVIAHAGEPCPKCEAKAPTKRWEAQ